MYEIVCEIKTPLILWKYQVILVIAYIFIIKVINYALWHMFESKRYMYFHIKTFLWRHSIVFSILSYE